MAIIIEINYTKQIIKSCLFGIQDYAVMMEQGKEKKETVRFAVRFPFWAVRRFLDLDMSGIYNQTAGLDLLIPGCSYAFEELFYRRSLEERIAWMESYLLGIFNPEGFNPNLYNSIEYLLRSQ